MNLKSAYPLVWSYDDIHWVFFLKEGMVKANLQTRDNRNTTLGFFVPGMTFAQSGSFFSDRTMQMTYETISECEVYRIRQETFWEEIENSREFSNDYLRLVLKFNLLLIDRIAYQNERGLENKIKLWLRFMMKFYGDRTDNTCVLNIPLTQEAISEFLHCSRESISITFNKLQDQKIISINKKIITINNIDLLIAS